MERADHDRSAQAAPAAAGTLDVQAQSQAAHRTGPGEPAGAAGGPQPAGRGQRWSRIGERWQRLAAHHPVKREAARLAGFIAAGIAVTWPLATYLTGYLPSSRDTASYVWGFWWMARQVTHLSNPWFTSHMAAPVGVQLGFHTLMPLPGLLLTPVTLIFGPGVSYNLMVLLIPGLLCYAMYRAARLWLRSAAGATAAAAFFGLSAMLTQQDWYHLNIAAGAMFLPMALEASVRLRRTPGRRQAVILGLVMGAAVLTDQESAVLAAIVTALTLLPWLIRRPVWARLWPAALAVAVGTAIASPQLVAMAQEVVRARGGLAIPPHLLAVSYKQYGIGLPGMFTPTPRVADFGLGFLASPFLHGRDNEGMPMFGTVLTVLALLGLAAAWRRRNTWLLAALWAGCAALALGTSLWIGKYQFLPLTQSWQQVRVSGLMPYTWFVRLPGLSSFREADRLAILGLLPAALLAGAAVDWIRYHARPLLIVVLALGILEAGYSGTPKVGVMPASYPRVDRAIAADHSQSVVVDIPFGMRGGIPVYGAPFFAKALVMATADGHPRAIAYTSRVPQPTISAIAAHPFYYDLIYIQHEVPMVCPWALPSVSPTSRGHQAQATGCVHPPGVTPLDAIKLSPARLAMARRDAQRLHIGWAVVWKRNISVDGFVLPYLKLTGFTYAYRDGNVLVYRRHSG
jgi:4-amino-4-deoxy-L-arabinose transferase-like glycosyltransferase